MAKKKLSHRFPISASNFKRALLLMSVFAMFALPIIVFAQTGATVRTRIGTVQQGDIIQAGLDLKAAYDTCNNGFTYGDIVPCLLESLSGKGYPQDILDGFAARQPFTLFPQNGIPCTQCLGYVGLVFGLATGDYNVVRLDFASDVARLDSFVANGETWRRITPTDAQPGDIAAHAKSEAGHIFIVLDAAEGGISLTALESNGNSDCRVTDTRRIINEGLSVFRRE